MAVTIVTRGTVLGNTGKGSPLSQTELDTNFMNLKNAVEAVSLTSISQDDSAVTVTDAGASAGQVVIKTNGTDRITINANGALGIGATPSYGTQGQVLTSNTSTGAVSWTSISANSIGQGDSAVTVTDTGTDGAVAFKTDGAVRFTMNNKGSLGIGASPAYGTSGQVLISGGDAAAPSWTDFSNNAIKQGNSAVTVTDGGTDGKVVINTEGTDRITVNKDGFVGIGVTPSSWGTSAKVLELGNGSGLFSYTGTSQTLLTANSYFNGTDWKYKAAATASHYEQVSGSHKWFSAATGNADANITWGNPKMLLDTSGNLSVTGTITSAGSTISGSSTLSFGSSTRQMINLWGTQYGIGVQTNTTYFRTDGNFAWFKNGSHTDTELDAGTVSGTAGTIPMILNTNGTLGLGVKPSIWSSAAIQVGTGGSVAGLSTGVQLAGNAYYNSGWKYTAAGKSARIDVNSGDSGGISFFTNNVTTAGTKDDAITFVERMTLSREGTLTVNAASLGAALGNELIISDIKGLSSNNSRIVTKLIRNAAGSDWTSATTRIASITDSTSQGCIDFNPLNGAYGLAFGTGSGSTERMRIKDDGNVGIGTTNPTYKLEVNGSFAATTKSFVINHPTKPGKKLRYGSLEGPENGVYVRGKLTNATVIELPEYWTKLVDLDSITVNLTPVGKHQKLYVQDIRDNKVYVANDGLFAGDINCFYTVYGERIDVEKLVVEC